MQRPESSLRNRLILGLGLGVISTLGSIVAAEAPIAVGRARPLTLAATDFDVDGFPDLVTGYGTPDGGFLEIRRGNPEAFAPRDPSVLEGVARGEHPAPFPSSTRTLHVAAAPDFMAAGDFDRDQNADLVVAARGGDALLLLAGDGKGGFAAPRRISLPGTITALTSGEIDIPDDHADLAVGIVGKRGAALLVYAAAERGILGEPAAVVLDAAATSLALGPIDESPYRGVAIVSGGEVTLLHGENQRDRRDDVALSSRMERLVVPLTVKSLALGFFEWNRAGRAQLALLADDGAVHMARLGDPDTRPYSPVEVSALRRRPGVGLEQGESVPAAPAWMRGSGDVWRLAETATNLPLVAGGADELIPTAVGQDAIAPDVGGVPVAAVVVRVGVDARPGLVLLRAAAAEPTVIFPSIAATIVVTDPSDTIHNPGCSTTGTGTCSLRDAILFSNANAGADTITFAAGTNGTAFTLTIANVGGGNNNEDLAQRGDLDINDSVTIVGNGAANTIIQAGTTNANGIDKVFAVNPFCASAITASFSGVTIRFGRNTQPLGAPDFSYTGGGLDWCNTGAGGMSITNSVVSDNTNVTGYGGGINLDSVLPATGSVTITGTTISNNKTLAVGAGANGGGLNLFGDRHNVTLTTCQITGNTATAAEGGGLFVRHTNGGAIALHGCTISGNVAGSRGGGVSILGVGPGTNSQAFTLDQLSVLTGNTSQGAAGAPPLTAEGGGLYSNSVSPLTTTILDKVTITNNVASLGSADQRGGGGIATGGGAVTVRNCRIVNNTAGGLGGSGLHKDLNGGTTSASGNWWGCSTGPGATPCDTALMSGGGSGSPVLTLTPYIVLTHTASPTAIASGQNTTLTASFLKDSNGAAIPLANLDVLIGRPITFNNPVRGSLSGAQATIQASATATATFTASSCGAGSADATVDNQPSTAPITIVCPPPEIAPAGSLATAMIWTDHTTLTWPANAQATSGYRLYRSTQAQFPSLLTAAVDSCLRFTGANQAATTAAGLVENPASGVGNGSGYLVTGVNIGGEGTAGNATAGPRIVNSPGVCP